MRHYDLPLDGDEASFVPPRQRARKGIKLSRADEERVRLAWASGSLSLGLLLTKLKHEKKCAGTLEDYGQLVELGRDLTGDDTDYSTI